MTAKLNITGWIVEDGPSREDLFDSLRLTNEFKLRRFTFRRENDTGAAALIGGYEAAAEAQILGIEIEDGSGHSWAITVQLKRFIFNGLERDLETSLVKLYYQDTRRKGCVLSYNSALPNQV